VTPETIDATARSCFETHRTRTRYGPLDTAVAKDRSTTPIASGRAAPDHGQGRAGRHRGLEDRAHLQGHAADDGRDQRRRRRDLLDGRAPLAAPAPLAAYHHLGVEFEVAVRLGDDLPASGGPWTRASVASKVAACLPAFELVEDGDADYKTLDAFTLIAQNTWNGGVVLGAPVTAWRGIDLEAAVTRCWINDAPSGQGKTGDALGHPFEAVAWLANLLNRHARQLTRDMIVMTGSSITTKFPAPGDRIRFAIDGLGEIALARPRHGQPSSPLRVQGPASEPTTTRGYGCALSTSVAISANWMVGRTP
jgi:hypothetical protein